MIESEKIMAVVVSMIVIGVGAFTVLVTWGELQGDLPADEDYTTTTYYNETYQLPDINKTNPNESWYDYSESGIDWMNVTNITGSDITETTSNQSFIMNTTTDSTGGALYDVVDRTYDEFRLDVKIDNSSHNYTMITLGTWIDNEFYTGHGAFAYLEVTDTNISFSVITVADGNVTTELYNISIDNNTWYHINVTLDYDDYTVISQIWTNDLAGVPTFQESDSATSAIPFTNITQSFWAIPELHGEDSCYIFMDNFQLIDDNLVGVDSLRDNIPNVYGISNAVFQIIGLVVIIASIMAIVGVLYKYGKIGK